MSVLNLSAVLCVRVHSRGIDQVRSSSHGGWVVRELGLLFELLDNFGYLAGASIEWHFGVATHQGCEQGETVTSH